MKVVLLAGGQGSYIASESESVPKPMVEIGGQPVLWHLMKLFSHYGFNEFVICCGFKQHMVKEYFADYYLHRSDVTFDFRHANAIQVHAHFVEPWRVTLVDTGLKTMTGGRVKRIQKYLGNEPFLLSYGDNVSNIDIGALVRFHQSHGKTATVTALSIPQRFGVLDMNKEGMITAFREKPVSENCLFNIGYMVFQPEIFDYLEGDDTEIEKDPLARLASLGELKAFKHQGFWQCLDTVRDRQQLEKLWQSGSAPWKLWSDENP